MLNEINPTAQQENVKPPPNPPLPLVPPFGFTGSSPSHVALQPRGGAHKPSPPPLTKQNQTSHLLYVMFYSYSFLQSMVLFKNIYILFINLSKTKPLQLYTLK